MLIEARVRHGVARSCLSPSAAASAPWARPKSVIIFTSQQPRVPGACSRGRGSRSGAGTGTEREEIGLCARPWTPSQGADRPRTQGPSRRSTGCRSRGCTPAKSEASCEVCQRLVLCPACWLSYGGKLPLVACRPACPSTSGQLTIRTLPWTEHDPHTSTIVRAPQLSCLAGPQLSCVAGRRRGGRLGPCSAGTAQQDPGPRASPRRRGWLQGGATA